MCNAVYDGETVVGGVVRAERHTVDDKGRPCPRMGQVARALSPTEAKAEKDRRLAEYRAKLDAEVM